MRSFYKQMYPTNSTIRILTHHIDLDRKNNSMENLVELTYKEHTRVHYQLWRYFVLTGVVPNSFYHNKTARRVIKIAVQNMIKNKEISFDKRLNNYEFKTKPFITAGALKERDMED
jgi:hypothetical protein